MALYIMIRKIIENPTSAEYTFGTCEDRLGQLKIDKADWECGARRTCPR